MKIIPSVKNISRMKIWARKKTMEDAYMSERRAGFLSSSLSWDEMSDFYTRFKRKERSINSLVWQLSDLDSDFTKIRRKQGKTFFLLDTFITFLFREMTLSVQINQKIKFMTLHILIYNIKRKQK